MQSLESILSEPITKAIETLFGNKIEATSITFSKTNPQFEGDITLVVFPYVKMAGKGPEQTGQVIGEYLKENVSSVQTYNVVKGFLNIVFTDQFWKEQFGTILQDEAFGTKKLTPTAPFVMVEYSSPNTNKPLHLGHVRNNLLGYSVSEILKADGNKVMKVNLVNDRGIHICKSMIAWQKFGNGETPENTKDEVLLKLEKKHCGDHLVGKYYVEFDKHQKLEIKALREAFEKDEKLEIFTDEEKNALWAKLEILEKLKVSYHNETLQLHNVEFSSYGPMVEVAHETIIDNPGSWENLLKRFDEQYELEGTAINVKLRKELQKILSIALDFEGKIADVNSEITEIIGKKTLLMQEAQQMLLKWESGDKEVKELWTKMNGWVYDGFAESYKKLGVDFDKIYYESNTYLLGKEIIEEGLKKNVFVKRADGAVIIDHSQEGLGEKVLLRSDGTSVYMTQDLGTAAERHKEFPFDKLIYVVGNEQEFHFKVLKLTLKKLDYKWADELFHLSYGMVELPDGKMKSREGTVVDADDLIATMEKNARDLGEEKGLVEGMSEDEKKELFHMVGMAALKYFILKVDPKRKMLFNPQESIDLHGNTGPFIQYTHARIRSIWRKSGLKEIPALDLSVAMHPKERELVRLVFTFPSEVANAAKEYSPALIANFVYDLAKTFNQFWDVCPVLKEEDAAIRNFRLALCVSVARTIKSAMKMLGIEVPEKM